AEALGQPDRLVEHHARRGDALEQFVDRQAEDVALDRRDALEAPIVRGLLRDPVESVAIVQHRTRARACLVEHAGLGTREPRQPAPGEVGAHIRTRVHRIEQPQGSGAPPGFDADHDPATARSSEAVRRAASAASRPLLPAAPPDRAAACSTVSQVRSPNPTGMPRSVATRESADAVSPATKSKCGVSPRITTPSATTAATPGRRAAVAAATPSSNAPSTHHTCSASSATPASRHAAT